MHLGTGFIPMLTGSSPITFPSLCSQLFLLICVGTGFIAMVTGEYRECLSYSKLKIVRLSSVVAYYLVIIALWICAGYCFKVCDPAEL